MEVNDGTSGAGYRLWYMRHGRLLIGMPALEVDVSSGFVHSAGTSIAMSRGLFKLYSLALQWQRDTTSASHGEEVSQIIKDTLLEAGIQFREPFFREILYLNMCVQEDPEVDGWGIEVELEDTL